MDGANTHNNTNFRRLLGAANVVVLELPPYTPQFNMAELMFNILKTGVRRERAHITNDVLTVLEGVLLRYYNVDFTPALRDAGYSAVCGPAPR